MHKLTKWSSLINFYRSKKKHNTIMSAKKAKKARKKKIMHQSAKASPRQPPEMFSTEHQSIHFLLLHGSQTFWLTHFLFSTKFSTVKVIFFFSGSQSHPCWQWCCARAALRGRRRGLRRADPCCASPPVWRWRPSSPPWWCWCSSRCQGRPWCGEGQGSGGCSCCPPASLRSNTHHTCRENGLQLQKFFFERH